MGKLEKLIEIQQVDNRMSPNRKYIVTLFSKKSQKEFQHVTENRIEETKNYFVRIRKNSIIPLLSWLLEKEFFVGGEYCDLSKKADIKDIKLEVYDDRFSVEKKTSHQYDKNYSKEKDFDLTTKLIYDFRGKIIFHKI